MAAVNNALYARNLAKTENSFVHSRNVSTISDATLFTSTTFHSQPTEPLLLGTTPQTDDQLHHIPRNTDIEGRGRFPCEEPLMIDDNPMNKSEKKGYWARHCPRYSKRWKWLKLGSQSSLAAWAIYNTVRYFITFTDFEDSTNQRFCLALGISTGLSFLLTLISFLLAFRDKRVHSPAYLSFIRSTLDYLSSFCLLAPAIVNFALIFIWKDSADPHFNLRNRCHLDVDVVWSASNTLCQGRTPEWAIWLILSSFRLALTLIVSTGYVVMSSLYCEPRRRWAIRGFRVRTSIPEDPVFSSLNVPHHDLCIPHQLSDSTLCGTTRHDPSPQNQIRLARSHSSSFSQDISPEQVTLGPSTMTTSENGHDLNGFMDRFQLMVSQVAQETDEALHVARSPSPEELNDMSIRDLPPSYQDDFDDGYDGHSHNHDDNMFNLPPVFPALGYNEFGLPYPPDQNIRVLNAFIKRMPTIESMGSGEAGSSSRAVESISTSTRPPTRNTLLSRNSTDYEPTSEPHSRANSLSARAELLVGLSCVASPISEYGELLGRTSPVRRLSTPISYVDHALTDTHSSGGSSGTSYHTATSESFLPPVLTLDTRSRFPPWGQHDIISDSELP